MTTTPFDPTLPYCTSIASPSNGPRLSTSYTVPRFTLPPWRLPEPPPGRQWHKAGFTQEMLPAGYRPLLEDEHTVEGDEWLNYQGIWESRFWRGVITHGHAFTRTRRPLPVSGWREHHGGECPVPPETVVEVIANEIIHLPKKAFYWQSGLDSWVKNSGSFHTITAYRIVTPASDRLAEVKAAHAAGKTVQFRAKEWQPNDWKDLRGNADINEHLSVLGYEWRVKPEPRYVAWDFNSRPREVTWVYRKGFLTDSMITAWGDDVVIIATKHGPVPQSYGALLNDWLQRDGSPCGRQVTD